jgi:hypothetical protein
MKRTTIRENYSIREAGEDDWPRIALLLRKRYPEGVTEGFLRKKYSENPEGAGRIFVLEDLNREIKGTVGFLPHVICSRRKSRALVMESVDLFLAPEIRGKKFYPEFMGQAMEWVGGSLIAFPNERSEDVTVRLGWERFAPIEDWVIPVGPVFERQTAGGRRSHALAVWILRACQFLFLVGRNERIELKPVARFDHSFDRLDHPSRVGRTSAYLNWRYVENPLRAFELFEFHSESGALGYCAASTEENAAVLYDFFSAADERGCIRLLARHFGTKDREWLVFRGVNLRLWKLGFFRLRSGRNLIAYNLPHESWVLTLGDSDW